MTDRPPKFTSQRGEEWWPHDYGKIYQRETLSSGQPRLRIAASRDGSLLLHELTKVLPEPYDLLYVLVVSRGGSEDGRYQSDSLSRADLDALFERFHDFWDSDGRHSVWVRSPEGLLVYDRHNIVYTYGPAESFEFVLGILGYAPGPSLSVDFAHQHLYHREFDGMERELTARFASGRSDLREGDENPIS